MKVIKVEQRICECCMEEHEVKTVLVKEKTVFKDVEVFYDAQYFYCDLADELYADETMNSENDILMKDAYRIKTGLLTSKDIVEIRKKYRISQGDLCILLGWGGKTVTRYESHQVQDRAHDTILKKINKDPEWFLHLLAEAKDSLSKEAYNKYFESAAELYEKSQDNYRRKAIEAKYAGYQKDLMYNGNRILSLDKVVDVIRYFAASSGVTNLYKVKLMKMIWYADMLSYKKRNFSITGLVYQAFQMGALPIEHNSIIELSGVPCMEQDMGDGTAYFFSLQGPAEFAYLDDEDKKILDVVIEKLGKKSKDEIVSFMHKEKAYSETMPREIIQFKYAAYLQI